MIDWFHSKSVRVILWATSMVNTDRYSILLILSLPMFILHNAYYMPRPNPQTHMRDDYI